MALKYLKRPTKVSNFPYSSDTFTELFEHVLIQTNQICTRKCPFCYYGNVAEVPANIELPTTTVYRLLDELHDLDFEGRLGLFEINEPLTDPRIYDFITYAVERVPKAWHMLVSNGDLLTEETLEKLFKAGLQQLSISVYEDKVFNKLESLKARFPNYFQIIDIMDLRNADFPDNRGGNISNYSKLTIPSSPLPKPCERIYKIIYIKPNGNVVSCFSDFFDINIMGNVEENTLRDIWFGQSFSKLRSELDNGNRSVSNLCNKCNYLGMGGFFKRPKPGV